MRKRQAFQRLVSPNGSKQRQNTTNKPKPNQISATNKRAGSLYFKALQGKRGAFGSLGKQARGPEALPCKTDRADHVGCSRHPRSADCQTAAVEYGTIFRFIKIIFFSSLRFRKGAREAGEIAGFARVETLRPEVTAGPVRQRLEAMNPAPTARRPRQQNYAERQRCLRAGLKPAPFNANSRQKPIESSNPMLARVTSAATP